MSKLKGPDGRIPDRLPDGRPAVAWERRWTEGTLPLWLVATAGGIAVIFVLGITVPVNYILETKILKAGALQWLGENFIDVDLNVLSLIMFIAVVSAKT